MANREGRSRSNEFGLPRVPNVFPMSFRSVTNKDRVGLKLTYMASADYTEVTIPHNMWHKHSMLRGRSGVSLESPIPQSRTKITRVNGIIDLDRNSDEVIGAQQKDNLHFEEEEHAIQKVPLLPVVRARTNERSRIMPTKIFIMAVLYRPRSWIHTRCNENNPNIGY